MKKVYMPTYDELYQLQDMGINLYKYILVKAIESIIMDVKVYQNKNHGILESIYKYLREDPYIAYSICRMYPEEIQHSQYIQNEVSLCLELISNRYNQDTSIYNLDNLSHFENGCGVLTNKFVFESTIKTLLEKLPTTPKYRFEYKSNSLLDNIFNCEIPMNMISTISIPMLDLAKIEPAYVLKYNEDELNENFQNDIRRLFILNQLIDQYAERYRISNNFNEYENKDILTNPDTNVKRLLRCIEQRKIK